MFTQPFIDFLNSDNNEFVYKQSENTDYCVYRKKVNDNLSILYNVEFDNNSLYSSRRIEPFCVINNKTNEILHIIDNYFLKYNFSKYIDGSIETIAESVQNKVNNFEEEVRNAVLKKFESKKEDLLKEITEEDAKYCKSEALKCVVDSTKPRNFVLSLNTSKKIEFIESLFFNYENLKNESIKHLYEKYKNEYKTYLGINKEFDKMMSDLETDDNEKFKSKILEIFNDKKYKNIKITYVHPNGDEETINYGKEMNGYGYDQIKRDILTQEKIDNIPIFAIKTIKWSRSTIFDSNNYDIDYEQSKKEKDFIKLDNIGHFPESFYKDPDFILSAVNVNEYNIKYITEDLKNDKSFCQNIANVASFKTVFPYFGDSIKKDVKFVMENFPKNISRYYKRDMLNILPSELFQDMEFIKFLKNQEYDLDMISEKMRAIDILGKEFREILGDEKLYSLPTDIFLYDFEEIEKVFEKDTIAKNFHYVDYKKLSKETILEYVFNDNFNENKLYQNDLYQSIISYFAEDNDMLCELARKCKNPTKFLSELHINPTYDNDSVLMFCSYSPSFISLLNDENKDLFINSAIDDIQDIYEDDRSIMFANDYFNIEMRNYYGGEIISINNKSGTITKNVTDLKLMDTNELKKILFEKVEEKFGQKVNTLSEALETIRQSTEKLEEEIEEELPF